MMSATVAGDGAGCWAEASAMIFPLGDPIALLDIRSHRRARGGVRLVAFAVPMRPDGAVGSRDDVSLRDMHGMILDDVAGGHDKSPGENCAGQ